MTISLISFDSYETPATGRVHIVRNPRECAEWSHMIGKQIMLDGEFVEVVGVEANMHAPPWREGEPIGIKVKP